MPRARNVDFFSDAFRTDPHGEYARLRSECPVAHASEPYDWWMATREADVKAMLRDYKLWSSDQGPGLAYSSGGVLVSVDPPQHTSDRRLVQRAFNPAALEAMEPAIRQLVHDEIDTEARDGDATAGDGDTHGPGAVVSAGMHGDTPLAV